jgi:hypothetical protein
MDEIPPLLFSNVAIYDVMQHQKAALKRATDPAPYEWATL